MRTARILTAVGVVPPLMVRAVGVTAGMAGLALLLDPSAGGRVAPPLLLMQLFATASGFSIPARRGHYDLALTRGDARIRVGLLHWCLSASPGLCAWLLLATMEALRGYHTLSGTGTLLGVLVVSTVPWALNVGLPRLSAAVGWLVGTPVLTMLVPDPPVLIWALARPWMLADEAWPPAHEAVICGGALVLSIWAMAGALWWIARMDVPLESAQ